jgi:hypothetical protein
MPATSGAFRGHGPLLQQIIRNVILTTRINEDSLWVERQSNHERVKDRILERLT